MKNNFREIFEQVKANHAKLEKCSKHNFARDLNPEKKIGKDWECLNCGGHVDEMAKRWYERGLQHG